MVDLPLPRAQPAFAGLIPPTENGGAVWVRERAWLGLATVLARAGQEAALTTLMESLYGLALRQGPYCIGKNGLALIATGPGAWLAAREDASPGWANELAQSVAGLASVSDQSGGYAVLRIGGAQARAILAKGIFLDLHPDVFTPGSAAVTDCAHMGVILWRESEAEEFDVALFRSYAASFAHWLLTSARFHGLPGISVRA